MGRIWFWGGMALLVGLCRFYSFWAVFGWLYAAVTAAVIIVCFIPKGHLCREKRDKESDPVITTPMECGRGK